MLYLPKLLILPLQLLLVDPVALDLGQDAFVVKVIDGAINFGAEVVAFLKEFELGRGVSAEGSGRGEGGHLKRLDVLMVIPVNHPVDQGIFAVFNFDIFCRLHFTTGEADVEGNVVSTFVQYIPLWDFWSWSIIFPSKPLVSLLPFIGWSISASNSW